MAKEELVFQSEKLEKRRSLARVLVPIGALCAVAVIAVVAGLLLGGRKTEVVTGGEDTPYPYTWTASGDKVTLELAQQGAPQGAFWQVLEDSTGVETGDARETTAVFRAENDSRPGNGAGKLSLEAANPGRAVLVLGLRGEGTDLAYRWTLMAQVTEENGSKTATLLSAHGTDLQETVTGGEENQLPYTIRSDGETGLIIQLRLTEEEGVWSCVSDKDTVALPTGAFWTSTGIQAGLLPGTEVGTTPVRLVNEITGTELTLLCSRGEDGVLRVLSHELRLQTAQAEEE